MVDVLTSEEAAQALRVHPLTVRRMIHRGELQGFSRPGLCRVSKRSVERLVQTRLDPPCEGEVAGSEGEVAGSEGPRARTPAERG